MRKPFSGSYPVSQPFGANPGVYGPGGHRGIDYALPGNTPLIAVHEGTVKNMGYQHNGFGNHLTLSFGPYVCYYGHLARVAKTGKVKEGEVIGYSDNTGWSTGNHLHFEVYANRTLINPNELLNQGDEMLTVGNVDGLIRAAFGRASTQPEKDKYTGKRVGEIIPYLFEVAQKIRAAKEAECNK